MRLLLTTAILLAIAPSYVQASGVDERLALAVARVATNEAPGSEEDLALVWQVVTAHGDTSAERLQWLRTHSPCASGRWTQEQALTRPGNCRWARNLNAAGTRPDYWRGPPWGRFRGVWLGALRSARDLVSGRQAWLSCEGQPLSWDGPRWSAAAVARGWTPLRCKSLNVGYYRQRGRPSSRQVTASRE